MAGSIKEIVAGIKKAHENAAKRDAESYSNLVAALTRADKELREEYQRMTKSRISQIIAKLEANHELDAAELELVKLWIVGDHESYVKAENDLNDWIADVNRVFGDIEYLADSGQDGEKIMHLRALLLDAKRSCMDIAHFLEKKECVARFEEATAKLDREERETLVKMLKFSISSDLS